MTVNTTCSYGRPGVQFSGQHQDDASVTRVCFLPDQVSQYDCLLNLKFSSDSLVTGLVMSGLTQDSITTDTVKCSFETSSLLLAPTMGDFTFWISLSLSLFAQSQIRTERKLNQKVKSIFLFGLSPNFGLSERLS